jgi:hypothetical protein
MNGVASERVIHAAVGMGDQYNCSVAWLCGVMLSVMLPPPHSVIDLIPQYTVHSTQQAIFADLTCLIKNVLYFCLRQNVKEAHRHKIVKTVLVFFI